MNQNDMEELQFIKNKYSKQFLFEQLFTDEEILQILKKRGLMNFLMKFDSSDLREAAEKKETLGTFQAFANRDAKPSMNVLNFTIDELVKRNWKLRLIRFEQYTSHFSCGKKKGGFKLKHHAQLGMNLVENDPDNYHIGKRSAHYNHAKQIEKQYGIIDEQDEDQEQMEQNDSQQSQDFIDDRDSQQISLQNDQLSKKERKIIKKNHKEKRGGKLIKLSEIQPQLEKSQHKNSSQQEQYDFESENNLQQVPYIKTRNKKNKKNAKQTKISNFLDPTQKTNQSKKRLKRVIDSQSD